MRKLLLLVGALFFSYYVFSQNLAVCGNSVDLSAEVENYTDFSWFCDDAVGVFSDANSLNTTFTLSSPFNEQGYLVASFYYNATVGGDVVSDTVTVSFYETPSAALSMNVADTLACGLNFEFLRAETPEGGMSGYWYEENTSTQFGIANMGIFNPVTDVTVSSYGRHDFYWIVYAGPEENPRLCVDTAGPWTINFVRQPIAEISTSAGPFVVPDAHVLFYNTTNYQDMENVVCEWHFGDGTSEDNCSESVEHVYAEADCYEPYLVVMSSNAPQCSSTARLENCVSVTTSIVDFNVTDIDISPNPATNFLNITSGEVISDIEIVNVMGQVVYRTELNSDNVVCDVEDLKAGVYIVRIYGTNTASVVCQRKFIKE